MPTCGNCKLQDQTVEHIRGCYATARGTVTQAPVLTGLAKRYADDFKPMAMGKLSDLPASKYALETDDGLKFYEVQIGKKGGRWDGYRFVTHLVGAPGTWAEYPVKGAAREAVLMEILKDPKAAAVRFSKHFTVCAACGSPLSDPESMERGLGPVCAEKF